MPTKNYLRKTQPVKKLTTHGTTTIRTKCRNPQPRQADVYQVPCRGYLSEFEPLKGREKGIFKAKTTDLQKAWEGHGIPDPWP